MTSIKRSINILRMKQFAFCLLLVCCSFGRSFGLETGVREGINLSGSGWSLWQDEKASWEHDTLFLPSETKDLSKLPVNEPTGGWGVLDRAKAMPVQVPGTVTEYLNTSDHPAPTDFLGVSWWFRSLEVPRSLSGKRFILRFESVWQRAEVYLDGKLVAYDLVGNSPFEADITDAVQPGKTSLLAVRVTNPGGNFSWIDFDPVRWGKYLLPAGHAFGGITGRVNLMAVDPVFISDIYIQNTTNPRQVRAIVTVRNVSGKTARGDLAIRVVPKDGAANPLVQKQVANNVLPQGDTELTLEINAPDAKLWDLETPNLYRGQISLSQSGAVLDQDEKIFGFRWFSPEDVGTNAVFRLNGKRVVWRTAISWGFWPVNGIYPTPELAEKQITVAKALGLNMLNFHRAIGQTAVLDKADELGLFYYEEPGGYVSGDVSPFAQALAREKLMRMVKRDRSHPSLVIYNMINEHWARNGADKPEGLAVHERDLRDAHALDPSRTITHTSAWAYMAWTYKVTAAGVSPAKLHMRPFDETAYWQGWFDVHRAGGPEVWNAGCYRSPDNFYARTDNKTEIVYDGEEGALSAPPRLEKIKAALEASPHLGWDGGVYLDWFRRFDDFLTRKNLRAAFPNVDALTTAMGAVSLGHQGRKIENLRICNENDGYAINGWEAETVETHSGIVDCFRNPKADPAILAHYNQPLFIAVKPRSQFVQIPGEVTVDFYAVNEKDVKGPYKLKISAKDSTGRAVFSTQKPVKLQGGEMFGELLTEAATIPVVKVTGMVRIEASLVDAAGKEVATGHDEILSVDWKGAQLSGKGAVWEPSNAVRSFLSKQKQFETPAYSDTLGKLDWVVAVDGAGAGDAVLIPAERFSDPNANTPGLLTTFFEVAPSKKAIHKRVDKNVDLNCDGGAPPDPAVPTTERYGVRWEGVITPPLTGIYTLVIKCNSGVRMELDGATVINELKPRPGAQTHQARIMLTAGKPVHMVVDYSHRSGAAQCSLLWATPKTDAPDVGLLLKRVQDDGTTLLLLDRPDVWMEAICNGNKAVHYKGMFTIGMNWLGGLHFVREHPLFKDLPVNCAMDWPYQSVVKDGANRQGMRVEGEELVVGCWHSYPMELGTAVGIIPYGKGRIVFSTLNICGNLNSYDNATHVARKLFCNFLEFGAQRPQNQE